MNLAKSQLLEFRKIIQSKSKNDPRHPDPETRKLLFYLFTNTRGGYTRLKIVMRLLEEPLNMHRLSQDLNLDYKAVKHHMNVLEKNNLVSKIGEKYGIIYHLSNFLEFNINSLDETICKLEEKLNRKKVYL